MDAVTGGRCAQRRIDLGAYVLGALDASERADLEDHLGDCSRCRDELVSLAALPGLLARVDPGALDGVAAAHAVEGTDTAKAAHTSSELLAERAVAQLRRTGGFRRPWIAGVAAAAVLLGVLAGATEVRELATGSQTVTASDVAGHVTASVRMRPRPSGTLMSLELSGVGEREKCALVAVAADGRRETAVTWEASYGGSATVEGQTSIHLADIAALEVVTLDGRRLVRLRV